AQARRRDLDFDEPALGGSGVPSMRRWLGRCAARFDHFLFVAPDPVICSVMRIGYASLLIVLASVWLLDAARWFSDAGVLRTETVRQITHGAYGSVLYWLPSTPGVVQ